MSIKESFLDLQKKDLLKYTYATTQMSTLIKL